MLITTIVVFLHACAGGRAASSGGNLASGVEAPGTGTFDRSLQVGDRTRTYRVHVPPSYDANRPTALVLAFHGRLGTGKDQERLSNMDAVADRHEFIVVYPDGVDRSWNAGHGTGGAERQQIDDVEFVSQLIDNLSHEFRVDSRLVYVTGMSNGGIFVHRLACELPYKIAAIASVAGSIASKIASTCHRSRPIPVVQFHGTADQIVPWQGGETGGEGQVESVPATIQGWATRNRCSVTPVVTDLGGDVTRETYAPCQGGAEVILYRIEGGGHTWPGGQETLPRQLVGVTNHTLNASEIIWEFFAKHPMEER